MKLYKAARKRFHYFWTIEITFSKLLLMKKMSCWFITAMLLLTLVPTSIKAETLPLVAPVSTATPAETSAANTMISRLNEIQLMDIKSMSSSQKKDLRKEVREIKSELRKSGEGVYLSVGAIIIIILLIILLL